MADNRPQGRKKNVTSGGTGVHKRGSGLGTGPVGSPNGYNGQNNGGRKGPSRAAIGGGISLPVIIIMIVLYMMGGGGGGGSTSSGSSSSHDQYNTQTSGSQTAGSQSSSSQSSGTQSQASQPSAGSQTSANSMLSSASAPSEATSYTGVDGTVADGARAKRTVIAGNGKDQVTLMVYMCGTDLESRNGMASSDLQEMASADFGDNVNIIVYTGGCNGWKIQGISSSVNQIYQVVSGGLKKLVADDGQKPMTDPGTLSSFIRWAASNYPANRYELILWDHGGGSVTGYGYDEKYRNAGSMTLAGINKALTDGGVTFDFIGFDACLMATAETALMLDSYADYMIASEETEPGIGWYYTNWLNALGKNTSLPTLDIGKRIVDDFVSTCNQRCRGQKTTLSVIDLAEFAYTVPPTLNAFSKSISSLISEKNYKVVSDARFNSREFASSSRIDQIDLVNLARNVGNSEGKALADALQGAIKYNKTSTNMTNAYGVSIYFPYKKSTYLDKICSTYDQIGMDADYAKAIREFASLQTTGQVASGGSSADSVLYSLLGNGSSSGSSGSSDEIMTLLEAFLGSGGRSVPMEGFDPEASSFLSDQALSSEDTAEYLAANYFDTSYLVWVSDGNGGYYLSMPETQWGMVHDLDLNMFYNDGEGYIDLGLDNVFSFDEEGNLIPETDRTWISINGQPVAYYRESAMQTEEDGYVITGRVPLFLNDERAELILVFDAENENGYIAGATYDYSRDPEVDVVAKNLTELEVGDKLEFICDYYTYDGEYVDSYYLGEPMTVTEDMVISNTDVGDGEVRLMYRFTDIYDQEYWTEALIK